MYCRKCGNKLLDDDVFCSKCGAKVIKDSPSAEETPAVPPTVDETATEETSTSITPNESTEEPLLGNFATWFFMYLFVFSLVTLCIVAMFSSTSVVEWVTVPEGFVRFLADCIGASLVSFLAFWPLLGWLSKIELIPKHWKLGTFFLMMAIHGFGEIFLRNDIGFRQTVTVFSGSAFILGILCRFFDLFIKKK